MGVGMKLITAKSLIIDELTKLTGFKVVFRTEFNCWAMGVKIGSITPYVAAQKILEEVVI